MDYLKFLKNGNGKKVLVLVIAVAVSYANSWILDSSEDDKISPAMKKDMAYLMWAEMVSKSIKSHISDIANATAIDDYEGIEISGKSLKEDAGVFLNQSEHFEISSELNNSRAEIQKSLKVYILVGKYVEEGGKNKDRDLLTEAANLAMDANRYMVDAAGIQNHTLPKIPKSSSYNRK